MYTDKKDMDKKEEKESAFDFVTGAVETAIDAGSEVIEGAFEVVGTILSSLSE